MRAKPLVLTFALTAALCACGKRPAQPTPSAAATIPGAGEAPRAAGLWIERVSDRDGVSVSQVCLDANASGQLSYFGRQLGAKCRRNVIAEASNGEWRFSTTCGDGASQVSTEGVAHGDFRKHYVIDALMTGGGTSRRVQADVSWQGVCPAGMKPGDMVLPGGAHARMADLKAPA